MYMYMYMYMYVYIYQALKPEIVCNILSVETATIYENILQQKHQFSQMFDKVLPHPKLPATHWELHILFWKAQDSAQ